MTGETAMAFMYRPDDGENLVERSLQIFNEVGFEPSDPDRSEGMDAFYLAIPYDGWSVSLAVFEAADPAADTMLDSTPASPPLGFQLSYMVYPDRGPADIPHEEVMDVIFELTVRHAMDLNVEYFPLFGMENRAPGVMPDGVPLSDSIDEPPHLGVYEPDLLDALGGIKEFFDEPWYTARLTDGRTVVIRTAWPWGEEGWTPPTDAPYIDTATLHADETDSEVTLGDPFAELEPGEYGADLVIPQERLDGEFRNEDAEVVRVYVDENHDLRRVENDSFLRNVVTDTSGSDGEIIDRMVADLPAGTEPDDVPISVLLNDRIHPSLVRLDDPDDENVLTLIMDLPLDMSKYDVFISVAEKARPDEGFTDEELRSIEGGLETLVDENDPVTVELWLRQNIL